ncbi:MAG: hypothetical protein JW829_09550 [Pirellulales bacterium]|nr:hypothetical protein [Pirellulales bacterium]
MDFFMKGNSMNRRDFLSAGGVSLWSAFSLRHPNDGHARAVSDASGIRWGQHPDSKLFHRVWCDGAPMIHEEGAGVMDGFCRSVQENQLGVDIFLSAEKSEGRCGPVTMSLVHQLHRSAGGGEEDLIEAILKLKNTSGQPCEVLAGFLSGVRPSHHVVGQQIYLPLTARGMSSDPARSSCRQSVGSDGFLAHYLEPEASDPRRLPIQASLLVPVVDMDSRDRPTHVALFGTSMEPCFFHALEGPSRTAWRMGRRVLLKPGESKSLRGYLLLHQGNAETAWDAFHEFGHHEDYPALQWTKDFRVHYYDFLSAAEADRPRGDGYDADLEHFGEFHVGMATQHGYYLSYGDFIHPDRKEWQAMPNDPKGPVAMSLEKIKNRVKATRRTGVHPMIYMHFSILDEGSPIFDSMRNTIQVDASGKPVAFGWEGPDVLKKTWKMSVAAEEWRNHLAEQAQWIMELIKPDGIVLDETFTAIGWDFHPDRRGPLSPGGIELMRKLREVVRSFGPDKALFASDCSMGNFCLWGDGEGGDHCYDRLLGNTLYREPPVRYMAALGKKAWQPCAWLFKTLWPAQMDLARKTGAGVGVTNGWGDNLGLARLPDHRKQQMIRDIGTLLTSPHIS